MLFLLPPSETKRDGGSDGSSLDLSSLAHPVLLRPRRAVLTSLVRLSRDAEAAMRALRLGPRLAGEVARNRNLRSSPTLRALERYTGVVYDPIAADRLTDEAWAWARDHVAVHSALFGPVSATDRIPAYRLSHDSRLPDLVLRSHWAAPVSGALARLGRPVVDLRSEGYVGLGPAPEGSAFVRIVSDEGGRRRALNHFNKKTKGALVSRLLATRPDLGGIDDFVDWARCQGIVVDRDGTDLVVVSESVLVP
jgi:cytoplasmic iron level regulating protein YaaA (DUF328/UPF0246 family)